MVGIFIKPTLLKATEMTSPPDRAGRNPNYTYATPQNSRNHESEFQDWNNGLQQNYEAAHQPASGQQRQSLNNYPLYRASRQDPDTAFHRHGHLLTSSQLATAEAGQSVGGRTYSLVPQQERNAPSHYSSMTTSLPVAEQFAGQFNRPHVYVTDPQPHGRYMNGQRYDSSREDRGGIHQTASRARDRVGSEFSEGYASRRAQSYPVRPGYALQQQVSVPGSIPSRSVRGAVPFDRDRNQLDYSQSRVNEHYVPPRDYEAYEDSDHSSDDETDRY